MSSCTTTTSKMHNSALGGKHDWLLTVIWIEGVLGALVCATRDEVYTHEECDDTMSRRRREANQRLRTVVNDILEQQTTERVSAQERSSGSIRFERSGREKQRWSILDIKRFVLERRNMFFRT